MKRIFFFLVLIPVLIAFSFKEGAVTGKIIPADAAKKAWIVGKDDSTAVAIADGNFSAHVKAGVYRVIIEAMPPYKNSVIEIVNVSDDVPTDLGEIKLQLQE